MGWLGLNIELIMGIANCVLDGAGIPDDMETMCWRRCIKAKRDVRDCLCTTAYRGVKC